MGKVTPIRPDSDTVAHMNATRTYFHETVECQRYENGECRFCAQPRLYMSPWCMDHFPWKDQVVLPLPLNRVDRDRR